MGRLVRNETVLADPGEQWIVDDLDDPDQPDEKPGRRSVDKGDGHLFMVDRIAERQTTGDAQPRVAERRRTRTGPMERFTAFLARPAGSGRRVHEAECLAEPDTTDSPVGAGLALGSLTERGCLGAIVVGGDHHRRLELALVGE